MGLLQKLLSTLGLRESSAGPGSEGAGETTVTVEHEPDTASESAVKGTDGAVADASASGSVETTADAADEEDEAAEPPEATSTTADSDETDVDVTDGTDVGGTGETDVAGAEIEEAEPAEEEAEDVGADDAEAEEATADDAAGSTAGSDESPDVLNGIGPAYAERLDDAGVATVSDLAAADAATLAEETGLGEGRISNWIEQAKEY